MSREEVALWIIVAQGFFVMYFEAAVWWMKHQDWVDGRKWREIRRKAILKKMQAETAAAEATKLKEEPHV
jgi:hypothetical protein